MTHVQVFFRKLLSKATFERKLSSVSLALRRDEKTIAHSLNLVDDWRLDVYYKARARRKNVVFTRRPSIPCIYNTM